MPKFKKLDPPVAIPIKKSGKRGRPAGSTNKEKIHVFVAEDGCTGESGIRAARFTCKHGYDMDYKKTVEK